MTYGQHSEKKWTTYTRGGKNGGDIKLLTYKTGVNSDMVVFFCGKGQIFARTTCDNLKAKKGNPQQSASNESQNIGYIGKIAFTKGRCEGDAPLRCSPF